MPTLVELQQEIQAALLKVPFNRHLGVVFERDPDSGEVRTSIPPRAEIVGPDGQHSAATVFALGDIVSSMVVSEQIAPRALELDMGAIFFTVEARFRHHGPTRGTISASASLLRGLDEAVGRANRSRKATIEVAARVVGEDGELAGEHRMSFYVRLMEVSRVREMAPESSEISRIHGL
jgi:acyl-coenzyme A thioesterase PaaI-like protein